MDTEQKVENGEQDPKILQQQDPVAFLQNFNLDAEVKAELIRLSQSGTIPLPDFEAFVLNRLCNLNKQHAVAAIQEIEKIAQCSKIEKVSMFFANIISCHQQTQEAETQGSFEVPEYSFYAPNPDHVNDLTTRSGYDIVVSTGQRKYGGPPPPSIWTEGMSKGKAELFIGSLHRDAFEPHIVPLIEEVEGATIYEVRLMMGYDGKSRGFAFVTFLEEDGAVRVRHALDQREFMGRKLHVNVSIPATRLFIGSIPKDKTKGQFEAELYENNVTKFKEVIMYEPLDAGRLEGHKNRGFVFVEFDSHVEAAHVKKNLLNRSITLFSRYYQNVDWADPINAPDESTMSTVKNLYVKGWSEVRTEAEIKALFEPYGALEKVKKINNYAFIHFMQRDNAITGTNRYK
jgi:RNA recognition motif-containing protein